MIIDLENHFYDQSFIDALSSRKQPPYYDTESDIIYWNDNIEMPQGKLLEVLLEIGDERIKQMDAHSIDQIVLSTSAGIEQMDTELSVELCKKTNDTIYELTQKYPGRFLGSMVLPVRSIEESLLEMERCVKELKFVAWHTHSNFGDTYPDDIRYRALFKKAEELGIYVYLHPQLPTSDRFNDYGFTFAGPGLGFTVDASISVMRLILSGLFDECKNLKMVIGHYAEGLPFLLDRIENRINFLPNPNIQLEKSISDYFKNNIWVTTSGNLSKAAFECTKEVLGIDKIMFGSDYPFESLPETMDFWNKLEITDSEREQIFYLNAKRLIGSVGLDNLEGQ